MEEKTKTEEDSRKAAARPRIVVSDGSRSAATKTKKANVRTGFLFVFISLLLPGACEAFFWPPDHIPDSLSTDNIVEIAIILPDSPEFYAKQAV